MTVFDVIVLGAGPAGENAAEVAVKHGLTAAIVERELVGGECSYWACIPSKALLRPGAMLDTATHTPGFEGGSIDVEQALARRNSLVANWDDSGQVSWLEGVGVTVYRGHGRITGERTVQIEDGEGSITRLEASRAVVVATGTSAWSPPIPGLESVDAWDNRDMTTLRDVPARLLIIGGGPVGVEIAQAWKSLGSDEVTILEREDRLLGQEEAFVGDELRAALEHRGVVIHTGAEITRLDRSRSDGPVSVELTLSDGSDTSIDADEIAIATGRRPNTEDLGLETIGLERGTYLGVDDHLRVIGLDSGWLYAVGDVNGRSLLTHTGKYQARIAGAHIAGVDTRAWGDQAAVPRVVFTSPQVAAVGLTEAEAREQGVDVRTVSYDIGKTAGASTLGRGYHGTAHLVIDVDRDLILGATFVGPQTGELLHAATVAIVGQVTLATLWHAIPSFPTLSEVWLRLLEAYRDEFDREFT